MRSLFGPNCAINACLVTLIHVFQLQSAYKLLDNHRKPSFLLLRHWCTPNSPSCRPKSHQTPTSNMADTGTSQHHERASRMHYSCSSSEDHMPLSELQPVSKLCKRVRLQGRLKWWVLLVFKFQSGDAGMYDVPSSSIFNCRATAEEMSNETPRVTADRRMQGTLIASYVPSTKRKYKE